MTPRSGAPKRIRTAYIVRESAKDRDLLLGKLAQTLSHDAQSNRVVGEILALGLEPFDTPERFGATLRRTRSSRTVVLQRDDIVVMYHTGSAAARSWVDEQQDAVNEFADQLIQLVRSYRPRSVVVTDFTRLTRSTEFSGKLRAEFEEHVDKVHFGGGEPLRPRTDMGRVMWSFFSMFADMERRQIVQRLWMGKLARLARGEWSLQAASLPFGYRLEGQQAGPDMALMPHVAAVIDALGIPGLTVEQRFAKVVAAGMTSVRLGEMASDGTSEAEPKSVAGASDPYSILERAYTDLEVYASGLEIRRLVNYIEGADTVMGFPVERDPDDETDYGQVVVTFEIGLPENPALAAVTGGATTRGWATPQALARATRLRDSRKPRGQEAPRRIGLLNTLPGWREGDQVRWLARAGEYYYLLSRAATEADPNDPEPIYRPAGGRHRRSGHHIMSINSRELLQSISLTVTERLETGVDAELLTAFSRRQAESIGSVSLRESDVLELRRQDLKARSTRVRNLLSRTDDERAISDLMADLEALSRELVGVDAALSESHAQLVQGELPEGTIADVGRLASILAAMRSLSFVVDRRLAAAVNEVFEDVRVTPGPNGSADWTCLIVLEAGEERLRLGPFRGTVDGRRQSSRSDTVMLAPLNEMTPETRQRAARMSRHKAADLESFMTSELSTNDWVNETGETEWYVRQELRRSLDAIGFGPLALGALPLGSPPELRNALWHLWQEGPRAISTDWEQLIHRTYFERPERWTFAWEHTLPAKQEFIANLNEAGGSIGWDQAMGLVDGSRHRLLKYTRPSDLTSVARRRALDDGDERVELPTCGNCGSFAARIKYIPELLYGLEVPTIFVCLNCCRPASKGAPTLPSWYF